MSTSGLSSDSNRQTKSELRKLLRAARRNMPTPERSLAEHRICENLQRLPAFRRARTVAAFLAFDGEPSIGALFTDARSRDKRFVVPVIRSQQMSFAPLQAHRRLSKNRYGIAEPSHRDRVATANIDLVLVPLVGFDASGNRLGMGGGYYDRYFSYLRSRTRYQRPRLLGVAFELQRTNALPVDSWDVPLWGIVSDRAFMRT